MPLDPSAAALAFEIKPGSITSEDTPPVRSQTVESDGGARLPCAGFKISEGILRSPAVAISPASSPAGEAAAREPASAASAGNMISEEARAKGSAVTVPAGFPAKVPADGATGSGGSRSTPPGTT